MIKENKLGNPINSSVLEIPKINDKVSQKNRTLLNQVQTNLGGKVNLTGLDINKGNFLTQLSDRLINVGIEPFIYSYIDEKNPSGQSLVSGGITYYIPKTDISVSYEPGVLGVGFGNLLVNYEMGTKGVSAGIIFPIN